MDGAQPADEDILARVGDGDAASLETLYDRYSRVVFSLILKMVRNRQVAEELTQEVYLRVWQQAATYRRDKGRFAGWILGIAHNVAIDELRRRKVRPQQVYDDPDLSRSFLDLPDRSPHLDEIAMNGIRRRSVVEALASLPKEQREVIEMSYFSGLTQSEIAERKGEPLGTIKTRSRLALQRLRAALAAQGIEADTLR